MALPNWLFYLLSGIAIYVAIGFIALCIGPMRERIWTQVEYNRFQTLAENKAAPPRYKEYLLVAMLFGIGWPVVIHDYILSRRETRRYNKEMLPPQE